MVCHLGTRSICHSVEPETPEHEEDTIALDRCNGPRRLRRRPSATYRLPSATYRRSGVFKISPSIDSIFINEVVDFSLVDIETGKPVERASWGIATLHNVPGDRGVMRSDGRYTAPRLIPDQHTVQIWAKLGGHRVLSEFEVRDPARPDPDATASPGDSHLDPVYGPGSEIKMSRPIDGGLRIGESVAIAAFDRTGRPLLVYNYEIVHENRVVDYAGTITRDGVYTAPPVVPNPPPVRIRIRYFREGASPGHLSSRTGRPIKIVP